MKKALFILIYLVGVYFAYVSGKNAVQKRFDKLWTVGDRTFVMVLSPFSWVAVGVYGLMDVFDQMKDDRPAKW